MPFVRRAAGRRNLAGRPSSRHFQNATQSSAVKPCRRHREAARNPAGVSGVVCAARCANSLSFGILEQAAAEVGKFTCGIVGLWDCGFSLNARQPLNSGRNLAAVTSSSHSPLRRALARRCARAPKGRRWRTHTGRVLTRLRYSFLWWVIERV